MKIMTKNEPIPPRVVAAVVATGLMSFCGVIVETAMNVTFPILMGEFNLTTNTVQWMTSIYLLIVAIVVPLSAVLKSSYKTRTLFTVANLFFFSGLLIDAFAPNFTLLLLGRAVQGGGAGIALPLMFNIIMEQVPQSKIGFMMGIGNLITGIAPAVGPTFGGIIASKLNWRWIFYILLPFMVVSFILGRWGIQQKSAIRKQRVDFLSLLMIVFMFSGLVDGFSNVGSVPFMSVNVLGAFCLGIIGMIGLTWRSLTIATPTLDLRLFKNHRFAGHVLGFFLTQIMSLGFAFLLPNYIQLVNVNTSTIAGLVVLPAGFAGAVFAPLGGKILDRFGARRPILLGMTLCFLSLLVFAVISRQMSNGIIATVYCFYMAGMGMCMGSVMTSALRTISFSETVQGNAILNTLQQFAGAMGTSIAAMIVASSQAQLKVNRTLSTAIGTQHAFIVLTIFSIIVWLSYYRNVED